MIRCHSVFFRWLHSLITRGSFSILPKRNYSQRHEKNFSMQWENILIGMSIFSHCGENFFSSYFLGGQLYWKFWCYYLFRAYYRLGCVCCISHCSEEYTNLPCDICGAYALVDGSSCHKIQQPCWHQHIRTVSLVFILHSNGVFAAYDVFCNAEYR